jgi:hypothetical protein
MPLRMNDASALKLLRDIAQDSGRVIFTQHARLRMRQRKVTPVQVLACLQHGINTSRWRWTCMDTGNSPWRGGSRAWICQRTSKRAVAIDVPSRAIIMTVF